MEENIVITHKKTKSSYPILIIVLLSACLALLAYYFLTLYGEADFLAELRKAPVGYDGPWDYDIIDLTMMLITSIAGVSALVVAVVAIFTGYNNYKDVPLLKNFNDLFLEVRYIVIPGIITAGTVAMLYIADSVSVDMVEVLIVKPYNSFVYPVIGITVAFPILLYVYLFVFSIKQLFAEGLIWNFFNKTLIGKLILNTNTYIRRMIDRYSPARLKFNRKVIYAVVCVILIFILFSWDLRVLKFGVIIGMTALFLLYRTESYIAYLESETESIVSGNYETNIRTGLGSLSGLAMNLNRISSGLEKAVSEEVKSQKMKTELITNVSHDLKTPLTGIINYSDLLQKENASDEEKIEYARIIHEKAVRLKLLIEDLFEISKTSAGDVVLNLENLDIVQLFHQSLGEMEDKISEKKLNFIINMPDEKIICNIDGRRTHRIFENILSNITKYSLESTRVYVDAVKINEKVEFTFKNISSYEMNFKAEELFQRLFRGDKSRSTEGSGLGLGITKNLVELQKGNIDISIDGDLFKLIVRFPIEKTEVV